MCREASFGHGLLNISADGKTMSWTWNRNQDGVAVVTDSATFVRDTTACPTRGALASLRWLRQLTSCAASGDSADVHT